MFNLAPGGVGRGLARAEQEGLGSSMVCKRMVTRR